MKDEATGYCFDFVRMDASILETYSFIENIKNKKVYSGKYSGTRKRLRSRKVVVFSNFLPNMRVLSIDRWKFFHTKLGEVFFTGEPIGNGLEFKNVLAREKNTCSISNPKAKCKILLTDEEFFQEYLTLFNAEMTFSILYENRLAFPSVGFAQRGTIKKLIKQRKIIELHKYVTENNCLQNSIVPSDFIKNSPQYFRPPIVSSSSDSSESEDEGVVTAEEGTITYNIDS